MCAKESILAEVRRIFEPLPVGYDHTCEVLGYAEEIARGEQVQGALLDTIVLATILHDIGAIVALQKHGSIDGQYQEQEGPPIALSILHKHGLEESMIERVCYIVGHHHSPEYIDGLDFQVVWEADQIASLGHQGFAVSQEVLENYLKLNFKTVTGNDVALKKYFP
jgi:hypothetical protein